MTGRPVRARLSRRGRSQQQVGLLECDVKQYVAWGFLAAPAAALTIGVWAEFADLGQVLLLAIAMPAMAVTLASLAAASGAKPAYLVVLGAAIGLATFAAAEGLYLTLHYARGGSLDFESIESQQAMAAALFGIHVAVGTVAGLALGCAGAVLAYVVSRSPRSRR